MSKSLTTGLVAVHSHRLEDLTEVSVKFIKTYPLTPLEEETVLVQSNGIAQWLKIELAKSCGIATLLNLSLPARFVWGAYRSVLGANIPQSSPFDKDQLNWRIMRVLPSLLAEYENTENNPFLSLQSYLQHSSIAGDEIDERKLYQLSARIADLFDQYQNYRADWLDNWTQGRFILSNESEPFDLSNQWQPILWRALVDDIGQDLVWVNRAELHRQFIEKAKQLKTPPDGLPRRVLIFGISSLPQQTLEVLDALKGCMQIVLCVHNPCMHYWANIVDGKEALKEALKNAQHKRHEHKIGMTENGDDDALHLYANPLLASWGKQGRDYIHLLDLYDETLEKQQSFDSIKFELFDETPVHNRLQQLQNDVLNLRPLHETRSIWKIDEISVVADDSIQFHICHSIQREVEVLHDQILAAFDKDSTLEPRDVMVMVPDINAYSPHIDAVFGRFDHTDNRRIPYTIADQSQRHHQPLLVALEQLLTIEQARVNQADVLSLLGVPAVQQRFKFTREEIIQIQYWLDQAAARWGLDSEHRAQFGMPKSIKTNSWWFALERMVFGYAIGKPVDTFQPRWNDIEPYHEVGGLSADIVGKLGLFIETLNSWWSFASETHEFNEWYSAVEDLLKQVFLPSNDNEVTLLELLKEQLFELQEVVNESGLTRQLGLITIKESWLSRIDKPNLNQRFLAGSVNFATLMPMRAIPFKHIYILGMSDDAYPRKQPAVDFDLMRSQYRPGDRSRRDDDRYLFLEAMLSAREKLYISWVGRSARDNGTWPPSVLVAQLIDHLVKGWCPNSSNSKVFLASLTTEHKLQAFNSQYLKEDSKLFTYAAEWQSARQVNCNSHMVHALKPWIPEQEQRLQLNIRSLVNFMREPSQPFFNQRLNTYFRTEENDTHDSENFTLDHLQQWKLNTELLAFGVASFRSQLASNALNPLDDLKPLMPLYNKIFLRLKREGVLGIGCVSDSIAEKTLEIIKPQLLDVSKLLQGCKPVPDMQLLFEANISSKVGNSVVQVIVEERATQLFYDAEGTLLQLHVIASKKEAKHTFTPYLKHLLLCASPENQSAATQIKTVALFRKDKESADLWVLPPINASDAQEFLKQLLELYVDSLSNPSGVVGEFAVDWLHAYLAAVSGSKPNKNGERTREPLSREKSDIVADQAVLTKAEKNGTTSKESWPYAARVERSVGVMLSEKTFKLYCEKLYAPMVLLELGQPLILILPEAFEQSDSENDGGNF